MANYRWRIIAGVMILFMCIELLDSNMFIRAFTDENTAVTEAAESSQPMLNEGLNSHGEKLGAYSRKDCKLNMEFHEAGSIEFFQMNYEDIDVEGVRNYKDNGRFYNENCPIKLNVKHPDCTEGTKYEVKYNSVSTDRNTYIWDNVFKDFKNLEDKEKWTLLCFATAVVNNNNNNSICTITVYPLFVSSDLSYQESADADTYAFNVSNVTPSNQTYTIKTKKGKNVDYVNDHTSVSNDSIITASETSPKATKIIKVGLQSAKKEITLNFDFGVLSIQTELIGTSTTVGEGEKACTYMTKASGEENVRAEVTINGKMDILKALVKTIDPTVVSGGSDPLAVGLQESQVPVILANSEKQQGKENAGTTAPSPNVGSVMDGSNTEEAGTVTEEAGTVTEEAGTVTEEAGTVTEEAGTVTEEAGTVTEEAGTVTEEAGTVTEEAGTVTEEADVAPADLIDNLKFDVTFGNAQGTQNLLENLIITENIKAQLDTIRNSEEETGKLTLSMDIKEDGTYLAEYCKVSLSFDRVDTDGKTVETVEKEANMFKYPTLVIDTEMKEFDIEEWERTEKDNSFSFSAKLTVNDENMLKNDFVLYYYELDDKIYMTQVKPDSDINYQESKVKYDSGNSTYTIVLPGNSDKSYHKKEAVVFIQDLAGNGKEKTVTINDSQITVKLTMPKNNLDDKDEYYLQNYGTALNRYDLKEDIKDISRNPVSDQDNIIFISGTDRNPMLFDVFGNDIDEEKSCISIKHSNNSKKDYDYDSNYCFSELSRWDNVLGRKHYVMDSISIDREGYYEISYVIVSKDTSVEAITHSTSLIYDMSCPKINIDYKDKEPTWWEEFLHFFLGFDNKKIEIEVNAADDQTDIACMGAYILQDGTNAEPVWINDKVDITKDSNTGNMKLNMTIDKEDKGKLHFVAYNDYGLRSGEDAVIVVVDDENPPVVHFEAGKEYQNDTSKYLENGCLLSESDDVVMGVEEEYFDSAMYSVYMLLNEDYDSFMNNEDLSELNAVKIDGIWENKEFEIWDSTKNENVKSTVHTMDINIGSYCTRINLENDQTGVLLVLGKDMSGNELKEGFKFIYDNIGPEISLDDQPNDTTSTSDFQYKNGTDDTITIQKLDVYNADSKKTSKQFTFRISDSNLYKIGTDFDIAKEKIAVADSALAKLKKKLECADEETNVDNLNEEIGAKEAEIANLKKIFAKDVKNALAKVISLEATQVELESMGDLGKNGLDALVYNYGKRKYQIGNDSVSDGPFVLEVTDYSTSNNSTVTDCTVKVTVDAGYYENFSLSMKDMKDHDGMYATYYESDYNVTKSTAFVVDPQVVVSAENLTGCNTNMSKSYDVGVKISSKIIKSAWLKVVTLDADNKETVYAVCKLSKDQKTGDWELDNKSSKTINLPGTDAGSSGDIKYKVQLCYEDFTGKNAVCVRKYLTADGTKPAVEIIPVEGTTAADCIQIADCKTETMKDESNKMIYEFWAGNGTLKAKLKVSDLHIGADNMKKSLVQVCKIPDNLDVNQFSFSSCKWFDIDNCVVDGEGNVSERTEGTPLVKVLGSDITLTAEKDNTFTSKESWKLEETSENTNSNSASESEKMVCYSEVLSIAVSGRYLIKVTCMDESGNPSGFTETEDGYSKAQGIVVDQIGPSEATVNYSGISALDEVTYNTADTIFHEETDNGSAAEKAVSAARKRNKTYLSTSNVGITLKAMDNISKDFVVKGYLISDGESVSLGEPDLSFSRQDYRGSVEEGSKYSYSYDCSINDSFSGVVLISIADLAGNTVYVAEGVITVDLVAAQLTISKTPATGTGKDNLYYTQREVTVTIVDNFWSRESVSITGEYGSQSLDFTSGSSQMVQKRDGKGSESCTVHTATLKFDTDGAYTFKIIYNENGSEELSETVDTFYIDKTAPVITNQYSNTDLIKEKYYNKKQTATLTIVEKFPVEGEEVAQVKKNGVSADAYNLGSLTSADTYVTAIPFSGDGYYEYTASSSDMAGNESTNNIKDSFILDTNAPSITKNDIVYSKKNSDLLSKAIHYLTFGYFCNESIQVTITASDDTSGIEKMIYYTSDVNNGLSKQTTVKGKEVSTSEIGNGKPKTLKTTFTLSPDFKGSVFVKAVDYANNESNSGNFLESNAVILKKQPGESALKSSIGIKALSKPNENGFYNNDFKVQLTAEESYDGMKNLSYKAGAAKLENVNFEGLADLTYKWDKTVNIKAKENDNNNVKVTLYYYDNVGNPKVSKTIHYKVDVTKPVLTVSYDNNTALNETYYKENRTAEIKIDELNFDPADVRIKITKDGKEVTGMTPAKAAWSVTGITHTAHITFAEDGDYEFSVEYTDLADNKAEYVHEDKFTIDKTKPEVSVAYDNNNSKEQQYYSKSRTATITVIEHNFDAANVKVNVSRKDKEGTGVPHVSGWSTSGDRHTAMVTFSADGIYAVDVESMDIAGNESEDWKEENFTIDQTKPEIKITGVKNSTAYSGNVVPILTYKDTNLSDSAVQVTVTGYKRGKVSVKYKESTSNRSKVRTLDMFPQKKAVDDVYTLSVTVVDKAGNSATKKVLFSVNRFGSNYYIEDDTTTSMLNSYTKDEKDVIIQEINVRDLKDYAVTCSKDGVITTLKEGADYIVEVRDDEYNWRKYVYTIYSKNFTSEGNYSICVSSTDAAGNISNNEEKEQNIRFTIDKTAPTLTTAGIESDTIYNAATGILDMIATDNIMVNKVTLYLNSEIYRQWKRDEIEEQFGQLEVDIPGSDNRQNIMVELSDIAGNVNTYSINDFLITQNKWVQYYNNRKAVVGTIGGAGMTFAAICFVLLKRKRS